MSNSEEKPNTEKEPEVQEFSVEMFKRVNKLKLKAGGDTHAGPGKLDAGAVDKANTVVRNMASLYPREIKNMLDALQREWTDIQALGEDDERDQIIEKFSNTANQIKDLASTFGYTLMQYFGESLRDYILKTDLAKKQQYVIVQAHIDVMWVAYRENLVNDDGGPIANELKKMVQTAIEKFN